MSERDKRENRAFVDEYIRHFLRDEASPGIEFEYQFVKEHLDGITVEDLNELGKSLISDSNRVVILTGPENQRDSLPSKEELLAILNRSEEHTSELQSLMRTSYAVFCLKKKKNKQSKTTQTSTR